jgi:ferredoxin
VLLTRQRFIDIHTYIFAAAAAVYLTGIFGTKILQPGTIAVLGVCCFNLLHLDYLLARPRQAACTWLVPLAAVPMTWQSLIEQAPGRQNIPYGMLTAGLALIPLLLLLTARPDAALPIKKRLVSIKVRIVVQTLIFMLYLMLTAVAWIRGSRVDLIFWGLFHVLATALLPFLVGRALCGWICPNATIQDALYKYLNFPAPIPRLPRAIEAQSSTAAMAVSGPIDAGASYVPATLLIAWFILFLIETTFDITQVKAYNIFFMFGVITLSFLFPWRRLCAYFCWIAGYKTLAGQTSLWRIRYNRAACRQCARCAAEAACPFFIDIRNQASEMPATCCLCFECRQACPHEDVITCKRKS